MKEKLIISLSVIFIIGIMLISKNNQDSNLKSSMAASTIDPPVPKSPELNESSATNLNWTLPESTIDSDVKTTSFLTQLALL